MSNISKRVIIETKRGKEKVSKYEKPSKEQKYFSKNIVIAPATHSELEITKPGKEQKYFSKYGIRTSSDYKKLKINIETKRGKDYYKTPYVEHATRNASTDSKKVAKEIDILDGVQYFTKNIVIQPVPLTSSSQNTTYTIDKSGKGKDWKESSDRFGNNNQIYSSGKLTSSGKLEKRAWEPEYKFREDMFLGKSSDQDIFTDSLLNSMDGFDENTKFYHKEITIQPVFIPPPKFSKH